MLVDRLRNEFIGCGSEIGKALERHILAAEQLLVGEDGLNLTDNLCAALVVETAVLIFLLFLHGILHLEVEAVVALAETAVLADNDNGESGNDDNDIRATTAAVAM